MGRPSTQRQRHRLLWRQRPHRCVRNRQQGTTLAYDFTAVLFTFYLVIKWQWLSFLNFCMYIEFMEKDNIAKVQIEMSSPGVFPWRGNQSEGARSPGHDRWGRDWLESDCNQCRGPWSQRLEQWASHFITCLSLWAVLHQSHWTCFCIRVQTSATFSAWNLVTWRPRSTGSGGTKCQMGNQRTGLPSTTSSKTRSRPNTSCLVIICSVANGLRLIFSTYCFVNITLFPVSKVTLLWECMLSRNCSERPCLTLCKAPKPAITLELQ